MIIDCHTHLSRLPKFPTTARELIASMDRAKIDKSFVFAGDLFNMPTEALLEEIEPYKKRLLAIGSVSPLSKKKPSLKQVENWLKKGDIYGLKFYVGYEYFYAAEKSLRPYLKLVEKYNRPAIFHSGDTWNEVPSAKLKYAHPLTFDDLAAEMTHLKIIIAHFGFPWLVDAMEVAYKNKNVYFDCSGLVYEKVTRRDKALLMRIFSDYGKKHFFMDRLLFGTDWKLIDQAPYVKYINELPLTKEEKEKVFYKNSQKVFNI